VLSGCKVFCLISLLNRLNLLYIEFIESINCFFEKENTMGYKVLFVLNALILVVFGAALLFVPEMALDQFQSQQRLNTEVPYARFVGSAFITLGLLFWFVQASSDMNLHKNISVVGLVGSVLAVVVTIIGINKGLINANSWVPIVVEVVFGLGYAFMLFLKPRMKE
jgi:FtsH-binding integral membrane protein